MKTIKILVVIAVAGLAAGVAFLHSGIYAIGADTPHWPLTLKMIEILRERSIAVRSHGIEVPPDLGDAKRSQRGAGNYDAMCAGCHLKPGMDDSEIRKGLYPQPPNLAQAAGGHRHEHEHADASAGAARQFWIIKHGLKMTAMPAWSKGGVDDNTIWDMVALLQKLPAMSPEDYAGLVESSEGHAHAGGDGRENRAAGDRGEEHHDAPGTPPHSRSEEKKPGGHDHEH